MVITLKVEPGAGGQIGRAGQRPHLPVARVEDRHPSPDWPPSAATRHLLQVRIDRRLQRLTGLLLGRRQHPALSSLGHVGQRGSLGHSQQLASGLAGQTGIEGQLQAADPGVLVAGVARGLDPWTQLGVGCPTVPVTSIAAEPRREFRDGPSAGAVPSLATIGARSPRVSRRPTRSPLSQADKVRWGVQAIFSSSSGSGLALDESEELGADPDLHLDHVVGRPAGLTGIDRVRGRGGLGLLVGDELRDRELLLGRRRRAPRAWKRSPGRPTPRGSGWPRPPRPIRRPSTAPTTKATSATPDQRQARACQAALALF